MSNNNAVSTNEIMEFLQEHVVVKEDIKDMVVKDDIADMATKQDITVAIGSFRSAMIDHVERKSNMVLGEVGKLRFDINEARTGLGQQIKDVRQELGQTKREILLAMKG